MRRATIIYRVSHVDNDVPIKSIGHGITCVEDLLTKEEVLKVMLQLRQDIGHKLRCNSFHARGIQITIRDNKLGWNQWQAPVEVPTPGVRIPTDLLSQPNISV